MVHRLLTDAELRREWKLPMAEGLHYLSAEGVVATVEGGNDAKDLLAVQHALSVFGLSEAAQGAVW